MYSEIKILHKNWKHLISLKMQESFDSWLAKVNYIGKSLFDKKGFNNNNPFFQSFTQIKKKTEYNGKIFNKTF